MTAPCRTIPASTLYNSNKEKTNGKPRENFGEAVRILKRRYSPMGNPPVDLSQYERGNA
jgi:hypothetical protein